MATDTHFADYVRGQAAVAGDVTLKKMFGEYGVYVDGVIVALACDNQLFLKPTPATSARLADAPIAAPYPGAKPHAIIDEWLDDPEALGTLLRDTAAAPMALPYPGAKPHAVIDEWLDDPEALAALLRDTAKALPPPKSKAAKKTVAKKPKR